VSHAADFAALLPRPGGIIAVFALPHLCMVPYLGLVVKRNSGILGKISFS
jgi:hypothetical protein